MIDYDKFKYRIGDKVRKIGYQAEYEIIDIISNNLSVFIVNYNHYRIKNLSPGCLDQPQWLSQSIIHRDYEPCNPAIKLLFQKKQPEYEVRAGSTALMISTPRRAGKSAFNGFLEDWNNRVERSDNFTDALRYSSTNKPQRKVSR